MAEPRVIIFFGPPGSGKGTQAEVILASSSGFHHFDTGRTIERVVHDPKLQDDPEICIERERFDKGYFTGSDFKMRIIRDGVASIAREGSGIIFSGSPRTVEEARMLVPLLEELYGVGSIVVFHLMVGPKTSIFRNSRRRVCTKCSASLMWSPENEKLAFCPVCGGELVRRLLDKPETITTRLSEHARLTNGILPLFKAMNIPVHDIDGEREPDKVAQDIAAILLRHSQ